MKQTAVEWLILEMNKTGFIFDKIDLTVFEQAKEIEKKNTLGFGAECCIMTTRKNKWTLEELYNKIFKK
jgi:hypothetical protein